MLTTNFLKDFGCVCVCLCVHICVCVLTPAATESRKGTKEIIEQHEVPG